MQLQPNSGDPRRLVRTKTPGIFQRGSRYVIVVRARGKQVKRFARTMAEARELKATLTADVARGEYREATKVTFAEYAPDWIANYRGRTSRGFREETRREYARDLGLVFAEDGTLTDAGDGAIGFFGRMRLAEIEPRDVKRYAGELAKRGLSPSSVRNALAPVRALLADAFEEGVIRSNPAAGVRLTQQPQAVEGERAKALTEDELVALLAEVPERWRLFVEFIAHTGMRISEAVAVRWNDVDFGRRRVHVRRRLYRGQLAPPKSRYGTRAIPLSTGMARALWQRRKDTDFAGDDQPVFASSTGTMLDPSNMLKNVLKPAARAAGVPWAGWHTLRHSAATMLFRGGANAKQVQHWLGHHSPAFTLATYVHLLPDDLPDADFLDGLTGGLRVVSGDDDRQRDEHERQDDDHCREADQPAREADQAVGGSLG